MFTVRRLFHEFRCYLKRRLPAQLPTIRRRNIIWTVPYNDARRHLDRYCKYASNGHVIIIKPPVDGVESVTLLSAQLLDGMLELLPLEVHSVEFGGGYDISIKYLPIHGYGETKEEALVSLSDSVVSYCTALKNNAERQALEPYAQALALKLMRRAEDKNKLMLLLSDSLRSG